jgi:hypothetical protein
MAFDLSVRRVYLALYAVATLAANASGTSDRRCSALGFCIWNGIAWYFLTGSVGKSGIALADHWRGTAWKIKRTLKADNSGIRSTPDLRSHPMTFGPSANRSIQLAHPRDALGRREMSHDPNAQLTLR